VKFKTVSGGEKNVEIGKYKIGWDSKSLSKFQFAVKQFLRPIWQFNDVYEELNVAGTKLKIDFWNKSKMIAIECDGLQHKEFNPFFHAGSRANLSKQIMRDDKKERFCELNGITLIRILETDVKNLTRQWFRDHWQIEI
jgi:hypothetical protein